MGPGQAIIRRVKKLRLPRKIKTEKDVRDFFKYLLIVDRTSFHPDDNFKEYVRRDNSPAFTATQAAARNRLMDEAWQVVGQRVYDIGIELMDTYAQHGPKEWSPYDS